MQNQWNTWLAELARANKGGVRLLAARRGTKYVQKLSLPGNFSSGSFSGQVRSSPDATGNALATFTFTTPSYDSGDDRTEVEFSLAAGTGANSTGVLPSDDDGNGVEEFPFDVLLNPSGGAEELLFGGVLPVLGRVTQ